MTRSFADTNILLYVYDAASPKRAVAEQLVMDGLAMSTQSLNECANVMLRKLRWSWPEVRAALTELRELSPTLVVSDLSVHEVGLDIAERYRLSIYDAMIVAAALKANCDILFSEDMHHGLVIHDRLTIVNPFREA